MKKLFVLIFTLTLSTSAFSWGNIPCDIFLDQRKDSNDPQKTLALLATASYNFFLLGAYLTTSSKDAKEVLSALLEKPPITVNQILYLIENECRYQPTALVATIATAQYLVLVKSEFKKKNLSLYD